MAVFLSAYTNYILHAEGGYVNNALDRGGETYAGIARNFWPNWSGWSVIDAYKKEKPLKTNQKLSELAEPVKAFYNELWTKNNFGKIVNQSIADILFDWFVNSGSNAFSTAGIETFGVDEILNRDFGYSLPLDRKMNIDTVNAINSVNAQKLYSIIKAERKKFYETIVKKNPSQAVFLKGWMNRINNFPDTVVKVSAVFVLLVIAGIFLLINNK